MTPAERRAVAALVKKLHRTLVLLADGNIVLYGEIKNDLAAATRLLTRRRAR